MAEKIKPIDATDGLPTISVHFQNYHRQLLGFYPKIPISTKIQDEDQTTFTSYAWGLQPSWYNYCPPGSTGTDMLSGDIYYYSNELASDENFNEDEFVGNISPPKTYVGQYGYRNRSAFNMLQCSLYSSNASKNLSVCSADFYTGSVVNREHMLVTGYSQPPGGWSDEEAMYYALMYTDDNHIAGSDMTSAIWKIKSGAGYTDCYFDPVGCELSFAFWDEYKTRFCRLAYQYQTGEAESGAHNRTVGWRVICSYRDNTNTSTSQNPPSACEYSHNYLSTDGKYLTVGGMNREIDLVPLRMMLTEKNVDVGGCIDVIQRRLCQSSSEVSPASGITVNTLGEFPVKYCRFLMNGMTSTYKNQSAGLSTFYDYEDSSYYVKEKAGLRARESQGAESWRTTLTPELRRFIPSYRFNYEYYPAGESDAELGYSNRVTYIGKCVIPLNAKISFAYGATATPATQEELTAIGGDISFSDYNIFENRDYVAKNDGEEGQQDYNIHINSVSGLSVPEWPIINKSTNFQINGNILSFMDNIDLISDSNPNITQKLFYSGELYGLQLPTQSVQDPPAYIVSTLDDTETPAALSSFTPQNVLGDGYVQYCMKDPGGSAPNGKISHRVRNLNEIKELYISEFKESEVLTNDNQASYRVFWHSVVTEQNTTQDIFEQVKIGRIDIKTLNSDSVSGVYSNPSTGGYDIVEATDDAERTDFKCLWATNASGGSLDEIIIEGSSTATGAFNCIYAEQLFETMVGKTAYETTGNKERLRTDFFNKVIAPSGQTTPRLSINGYMFSYGTTGIFADINTKNYSSAKTISNTIESEYGEERTEYTIADEISYECELYGKLTGTEYDKLVEMVGEDVAKNLKLTLGEGAKSVWYLYIDKTSNDVDPSIKLKILDVKATDEFGENWDDINIRDITENLKRGNGEYGNPTDADMSTVMQYLFDDFEKNYYRIKVRFSLYVDGEGMFVDDTGYRVVLGYAAIDSKGESLTIFDPMANSDTAITRHLPYPNNYDENFSTLSKNSGATFLKRNYHYFAKSNKDDKWRRDLDEEEYGSVYVSMSADGVTTLSGKPMYENLFSCVISGDDATISEWAVNHEDESGVYQNTFRVWDIDQHEDRSNYAAPTITSDRMYYVESENEHFRIELGGQSGKYVNFTRRHGCYVITKKESDFYFKMANNEAIEFWADVQYRTSGGEPIDPDMQDKPQGLYMSVSDNPDPTYETFYFSGNDSANNICKIYDIPVKLGDNWCQMYYKGNGFEEGKYSIVFGSINGTPVDITTDATPVQISYDNMYGRVENGVDNRRIHVFIQKASDDGKSSDIPNMYYMLETIRFIPSGETYNLVESYYEANGGFDIGFKDFEVPTFSSVIKTIPGELTEGQNFYIVNRYKNFGVQPYYTLANKERIISDGHNSIELTSVITDWRVCCKHNDNVVWDTGDKYMKSVFDTAAFIKVTCEEDDAEIGTMTYGEVGYQLDFVGQPNFGMTITVGDVVRKVYYHDYKEGEDTISGSIHPINCLTPIYVTYKKDIVSIDDDIVLVNNTDNTIRDPFTQGYYDKFTVSVLDLGLNWEIPANESEKRVETSFSDAGEYDSAVYADLSTEWQKNDEGLTRIKSIDAPKLTILVRTTYDERVTRVLDGYVLKYPYGLNDILFAPNEWLTADNLNLRFEKIMEDLKYLKYQTKFYLKPPTTYGGYYGDFETVLDGVRQRQYGYVPNGDLEIYRKTNENDSIDDENTILKNCKDMCTDGENNLYASVGSDIVISNTAKYGAELGRIMPHKINEFIESIDRIEYSENTDLLYMLCRKTNKLYIFNSYKFSRRKQAMNISYYGEIGGYGGLTANNKFNYPTDMCISTTDDGVDDIWVCDTGNKAVKRFSIKGQWISTINLSEIEDDIIGICSDFKNQIHVLTQKLVYTFTRDGELKNIFKLEDEIKIPLMIRPQYQSGFLYILYEHWVAKYSYDGKFVARFAENNNLTYRAIYANSNFDVYISTEKNILRYNDSLVLRELGVTENADKLLWTPEEYRLNKNENVQDAVINTAFQRIYDNIVMYARCIFGKIVELDSEDEEERISDLDQSEYQKILDAIHKERIFVGINELVTVDVINRSLKQMYDLLELILQSI